MFTILINMIIIIEALLSAQSQFASQINPQTDNETKHLTEYNQL